MTQPSGSKRAAEPNADRQVFFEQVLSDATPWRRRWWADCIRPDPQGRCRLACHIPENEKAESSPWRPLSIWLNLPKSSESMALPRNMGIIRSNCLRQGSSSVKGWYYVPSHCFIGKGPRYITNNSNKTLGFSVSSMLNTDARKNNICFGSHCAHEYSTYYSVSSIEVRSR